MTIFYDPTEERPNTRLPQTVIDSGQALPGLETMTGADLLISNLRMPPLTCCDESEFSILNLRKHCQYGLLVQRKTGRDFTSSITKLADIIARMKQWTDIPWLVFIGDLKVDSSGQAIIDGQETGFTYSAVEGALSYWQLRGGYYSILSRDSLLPQWVNGWIERLKRIQSEPTYRIFRPIQQAVINVPAWYNTLSTFPNVGPDRARLIAEECGSLWNAIEFLSDASFATQIDGIGKVTIQQARKHLGYPTESVALKLSSIEEKENGNNGTH